MLKLRERHKGRRCFSDCDACRWPDRCPFRQAATSARPVSKGSSSETTPYYVPEKEGSRVVIGSTRRIGFLLLLPFLIIDLVVASNLMSTGRMMLPRLVVSCPSS
jgi:hypothetical protein